ncbi:hypothetical protein FXO37_21925 [Capsicum annuum]|nr:hypothetical protein FXO37_21925 [Capsicum annuum]
MRLHPLVSSTSNLLNEDKCSKASLVRRLHEDNLNSITDLALLGTGDLPIVQLCIRGCERVTDKGIKSLFHTGRKICNALLVLDGGYIPKIADVTIFTNISAAKALSDLSLRFCDEVTDAVVQMQMDRPNHNSSQLQRLVLCNCRGLSADATSASARFPCTEQEEGGKPGLDLGHPTCPSYEGSNDEYLQGLEGHGLYRVGESSEVPSRRASDLLFHHPVLQAGS